MSLLSSVVRPLGSNLLEQREGPAFHVQQVARSFTPMRAVSSSNGQQEGDISASVPLPMSSVPSQGRQPPEAGAPVPA